MNTTPDDKRNETIDIFMQLDEENKIAVLAFAKMIVFAQDLPAEQTPSIDEWENTPPVVQRLLVIAIDLLRKTHIDNYLYNKTN